MVEYQSHSSVGFVLRAVFEMWSIGLQQSNKREEAMMEGCSSIHMLLYRTR